MSRCRRLCVGLVSVSCLLMLLAMISISNSAVAQTDSNPKWDLFVGYQWLHPGGTVPTPFGDPLNPVPFKIPDMSKGFGSALTYNFDPHWGAEFDFGHNWGDSNYETTGSVGPRFIWRTDTVNYFVHGLVSYNRLSVGGLNPDNGIGAILGGGMDLPIRKWISLRLFEADYVWAHHHYAHEAAADFPDLRRPSLEGVRLRTGLVFNWGGAPEVAPAVTCSVKPTEVMVGEPILEQHRLLAERQQTLAQARERHAGARMGMDDAVDVGASGMNGAVNREARLVHMRAFGRDHLAVDIDAHQRRCGDLFEHGSEAIDQEMIMRSRDPCG